MNLMTNDQAQAFSQWYSKFLPASFYSNFTIAQMFLFMVLGIMLLFVFLI